VRTLQTLRRCHPAIGFATATASASRRFSAVWIMNTGSNDELPEDTGRRRDYFRMTVVRITHFAQPTGENDLTSTPICLDLSRAPSRHFSNRGHACITACSEPHSCAG